METGIDGVSGLHVQSRADKVNKQERDHALILHLLIEEDTVLDRHFSQRHV